MSQDKKPEVGSIGWHDLTVADGVRDLSSRVVGWRPELPPCEERLNHLQVPGASGMSLLSSLRPIFPRLAIVLCQSIARVGGRGWFRPPS